MGQFSAAGTSGMIPPWPDFPSYPYGMKIAREGWIVIIPFCLVALLLPLAGYGIGLLIDGQESATTVADTIGLAIWLTFGLGAVAIVLIGWCFWFFRDPDRTVPAGAEAAGQMISPADGRIIIVDQATFPLELQGGEVGSTPVPRIAIFLNVFNVHVNRVPATGEIVKVQYVPGKFVTASLDKASHENERSSALLRDRYGRLIGFCQIAGLVARRIVNHLKVGQQVTIGERFGLIRFGSRAELFFPPGTSIQVKVGQKVVAGETVLAVLPKVGQG